MPILGILASSTAVAAGSFESIATVTVGSGGSSSVEFTSIPSTYTHLQIRGISRSNRSLGTDSYFVTVNSDAGSNYAYHALRGNGSVADAFSGTSQTSMLFLQQAGGNAGSNVFGVIVLDVLDYTNTNKYKTFRTLGGIDDNGSGNIGLTSGLWMSTNSISSIKLVSNSGNNFQQYSSFALYGIKSA